MRLILVFKFRAWIQWKTKACLEASHDLTLVI